MECCETRKMSVHGYKQTSSRPKSTSALPPKADVDGLGRRCVAIFGPVTLRIIEQSKRK